MERRIYTDSLDNITHQGAGSDQIIFTVIETRCIFNILRYTQTKRRKKLFHISELKGEVSPYFSLYEHVRSLPFQRILLSFYCTGVSLFSPIREKRPNDGQDSKYQKGITYGGTEEDPQAAIRKHQGHPEGLFHGLTYNNCQYKRSRGNLEFFHKISHYPEDHKEKEIYGTEVDGINSNKSQAYYQGIKYAGRNCQNSYQDPRQGYVDYCTYNIALFL